MKTKFKFVFSLLLLLILLSLTVSTQANWGPRFIWIFGSVLPLITKDSPSNDISNDMLFAVKYLGNEEMTYQWEAYQLIGDGKVKQILGPQTETWTLNISVPTIVKVTARNKINPLDFDVAFLKVIPPEKPKSV